MWMLVNNKISYYYGTLDECMKMLGWFFPDRKITEVMKMGWTIDNVERSAKIGLAK